MTDHDSITWRQHRPLWSQMVPDFEDFEPPTTSPPQRVLKTSSWISCATLVACCRMAMASPTEFACTAGRTSQQAEPKNLTEKLWQKQRKVADLPTKKINCKPAALASSDHWVGLRDVFSSWQLYISWTNHPTATKNQDKNLVRHVRMPRGPVWTKRPSPIFPLRRCGKNM